MLVTISILASPGRNTRKKSQALSGAQRHTLVCPSHRRAVEEPVLSEAEGIPTQLAIPYRVREFSRENSLMQHGWRKHSRDPSTPRPSFFVKHPRLSGAPLG
jgi:hypothetical protein